MESGGYENRVAEVGLKSQQDFGKSANESLQTPKKLRIKTFLYRYIRGIVETGIVRDCPKVGQSCDVNFVEILIGNSL